MFAVCTISFCLESKTKQLVPANLKNSGSFFFLNPSENTQQQSSCFPSGGEGKHGRVPRAGDRVGLWPRAHGSFCRLVDAGRLHLRTPVRVTLFKGYENEATQANIVARALEFPGSRRCTTSAAAHKQRTTTAAFLVGSEPAGKWDTPSRFQATPTEPSRHTRPASRAVPRWHAPPRA